MICLTSIACFEAPSAARRPSTQILLIVPMLEVESRNRACRQVEPVGAAVGPQRLCSIASRRLQQAHFNSQN